jgi:hypothetical protein
MVSRPSQALLACTALFLLLALPPARAVSPYWTASPLPRADLAEQLSRMEKKLQAAGFTVLGRHTPQGLADRGAVVFTDKALLAAVRSAGGHAVLASALRAGVTAAGEVSYTNPGYWLRAYLRSQFSAAEPMAQDLQNRLAQALGQHAPLGGDVTSASLLDYKYMTGMEKLDSIRNELHALGSHEEAVKTVQAHLAKGVEGTTKVYEVLLPEQKLAVFGVAMNQPGKNEGWWVSKLGAAGPEHTAALPYEIYVVGQKVYSPYGRYRIALAWPGLDLGQFMSIRYAPDVILQTMKRVAGAPEPGAHLN